MCVFTPRDVGQIFRDSGRVVGMRLDGEIRSSNSGIAKSGFVETSPPQEMLEGWSLTPVLLIHILCRR